eukprot:960830-Amphidinium_carterae.1
MHRQGHKGNLVPSFFALWSIFELLSGKAAQVALEATARKVSARNPCGICRDSQLLGKLKSACNQANNVVVAIPVIGPLLEASASNVMLETVIREEARISLCGWFRLSAVQSIGLVAEEPKPNDEIAREMLGKQHAAEAYNAEFEMRQSILTYGPEESCTHVRTHTHGHGFTSKGCRTYQSNFCRKINLMNGRHGLVIGVSAFPQNEYDLGRTAIQ